MSTDALNLLKFLIRNNTGWHSVAGDSATRKAVKRLQALGLCEVCETGQIRLCTIA